MKRITSVITVAALLILVCCASFSFGSPETVIEYIGEGSEAYTVTVPSLLNPGNTGEVELTGTWASNRIVTVTSDTIVEMSNDLDDTTLDIEIMFNGISENGNNISEQTFTEDITVGEFSALFGTWRGILEYNVSVRTAEAPLKMIMQTVPASIDITENEYTETNTIETEQETENVAEDESEATEETNNIETEQDELLEKPEVNQSETVEIEPAEAVENTEEQKEEVNEIDNEAGKEETDEQEVNTEEAKLITSTDL